MHRVRLTLPCGCRTGCGNWAGTIGRSLAVLPNGYLRDALRELAVQLPGVSLAAPVRAITDRGYDTNSIVLIGSSDAFDGVVG
jgi:hypothetical protein